HRDGRRAHAQRNLGERQQRVGQVFHARAGEALIFERARSVPEADRSGAELEAHQSANRKPAFLQQVFKGGWIAHSFCTASKEIGVNVVASAISDHVPDRRMNSAFGRRNTTVAASLKIVRGMAGSTGTAMVDAPAATVSVTSNRP